ncbi:MAG: DNA-binding protein [Pyrobaculum sp.]
MSPEAIADSSFLIDWSRYSRRDLLTWLFDVVHVPESVLREIQLPPAVDWVAERLADGSFALFTETPEIETKARELMALSRSRPLKAIDYPEAVCLAAGLRFGYTVLSENGGAFFAPRVLNLGVAVWRAFEVLVEAWRRGLVQDIVEELRRYEQEALHLFRRRDWEYIWSLVGRR